MSIKFSQEDAKTIAKVARLDSLGRNGARLILLAPIVDLVLAMDSPIEFSANVALGDLEEIAKGAKAIAQVAACSAFEEVVGRLEDAEGPTGDALNYFQKLKDSLESRCSG